MNFVLYYASVDPVSRELQRFDAQCVVVRDRLGFSTPEVDPNIDVPRHLDRTGYPENGEQLVIFFLDLSRYILVSSIQDTQFEGFSAVVPFSAFSCNVYSIYDQQNSRIVYNVKDVFNYQQSGCSCGTDTNCAPLFQRAFYGYLRPDSTVITYTHCSTIPVQKLVPFFDSSRFVACPCSE